MQVERRIAVAAAAALCAGFLGLNGATAEEAAAEKARVGHPAPGFSLKDLHGKSHQLSSYKGKPVVLEWFNPDCPMVVKHHKHNTTMRDLAKRYAERGVVWLAINSGAEGKQGAGVERNTRAVTEYDIPYPVLLDPTGATGRTYGAKVTPHMFVIDAEGKLVYAGAIDNDTSRKQAGDVNYVAQALDAVLAGEEVETAGTRAYG